MTRRKTVMITDSSIRKSVDEYVKRRLKTLPDEIAIFYPQVKKIWKCDNVFDFLYGYCVGNLEVGTMRYLLKFRRASPSTTEETLEIREMIETHRKELQETIRKAIS